MSASIGVAFTGHGTDAPEELLHDADLAMYRAKRDRVGSHGILDLRELDLAEHHAGLARGLPGATDRGELHLDYQPIVNTVRRSADRGRGAAALDAPTRGAVSPTVFIPFAEQSGQIVATRPMGARAGVAQTASAGTPATGQLDAVNVPPTS